MPLILGDCLERMAEMDPDSVDAVVTDPPYGLGFMGKCWDGMPPGEETAVAMLRLLKPAHYLVAFGGTRTHHRLMVALEDAGFEIRDCLMWLYAQGFPKGKGCLKPAYEPIILCRKPGAKVRALGIDECRIDTAEDTRRNAQGGDNGMQGTATFRIRERRWDEKPMPSGRWPANILLDEEAAAMLDEQSGEATPKLERVGRRGGSGFGSFDDAKSASASGRWPADPGGGASRFFYSAKSSRSERNRGCEGKFVTLELEVCPCGEHTEVVTSLARAMSEWETGQVGSGCNTISFGSRSTGQYLAVAVYTTSTETSRTTVSKTSNVWTSQPISDCIADVFRTLGAHGISLADGAESLSRSLSSTRESLESVPGASVVVSKTPLRISASVVRRGNIHPTCKTVALMRWLVRLIAPPGGVVLDPFMGSGTTGVAAVQEGRFFVGIEREAEYLAIAEARIHHAEETLGTPDA